MTADETTANNNQPHHIQRILHLKLALRGSCDTWVGGGGLLIAIGRRH